MMTSVNLENILNAARALTEAERVRVVEELLATLPDSEGSLDDDQMEAELERRFAEYQSDPSKAVPWTEIKRPG